MRMIRTMLLGGVAIASLAAIAAATPARADDWHHDYRRDWHRPGPRVGVVVAPPPGAYYAPPPPVVVAPPAVVVAPPPVVIAPPVVALGIGVHIR